MWGRCMCSLACAFVCAPHERRTQGVLVPGIYVHVCVCIGAAEDVQVRPGHGRERPAREKDTGRIRTLNVYVLCVCGVCAVWGSLCVCVSVCVRCGGLCVYVRVCVVCVCGAPWSRGRMLRMIEAHRAYSYLKCVRALCVRTVCVLCACFVRALCVRACFVRACVCVCVRACAVCVLYFVFCVPCMGSKSAMEYVWPR